MFDADAAVDQAEKQAASSGLAPVAHLSLTLLDELHPEKSEMPPVAADALEVADRYWRRGLATADELDAARVACWKYLDAKNGNSTTIDGLGDHLTRAVICVLYPPSPDGPNDLGDTADWFRAMLAGAAGSNPS